MNQELALKLKDAGFPQGIKRNETCQYDKDLVYFPSLSELIDECGNEFFCLKKSNQWIACTAGSCNPDFKQCYGSTPEEVVTNLWLALHTK